MIRFVLADLRRHGAGAVVVLLLVAFATGLGMAVRMEERALRLGSARAADRFDLVVGAPGSETQLVLTAIFLQPAPLTLLPGTALKRLDEDPRVEMAAPVAFGDSYYGFPIVGTTAAFVEGSGFRIAEGGHGFTALDEAVVGARTPFVIGDRIRPMHGLPGQESEEHDEIVYRVAGRLEPSATPWDRAILTPVEGVWRMHGLGEEHGGEGEHEGEPPAHIGPPWGADTPGVPAIVVKPRSIANAYQLRGENRSETSLAVFPGEVLTRLYATLGDARMALTAIAIGTQALAAAAVILVAMMHLSQRRRQIGALRAFGAPRLAVFGVVWAELLLIIGGGVVAGVALGYAGARALAAVFVRQSGMALPVTLEASDVAFAGLLLLVGAGIAVIPAVLAYRQPTAQSLRA